jgi:serine/threonine protein kinase
MEKADKTLSNLMNTRRKNNKMFTNIELLEFWRKCINVFAYCHVVRISHNDIKPSNILLQKIKNVKDKGETENELNEAYHPKISDFGTSIRQMQENDNNVRVLNSDFAGYTYNNDNRAMTPAFASPNILQNNPKVNNYLEDIFSLGMSFL